RIMESQDRVSVVVNVRVEAGQVARVIFDTGESIHTAMVIFPATTIVTVPIAVSVSRVIRTVRRISQRPKVVVKGMILLHHDDDVLDSLQIAPTRHYRVPQQRNPPRQRQPPNRMSSHPPLSS